jgi:S1-C subfamily serine protease
LDVRLRRRFNIQHGVLIAFIERQGVFDRAGVERGLLITSVNEKPVFDVNTIWELFTNNDEILIKAINPNGDIVFFEVSK